MSRIGLSPITLPNEVEYTFEQSVLNVKSSKGNLSLKIDAGFTIIKDNDNTILIKRPNDSKDSKSKHGLYRSLTQMDISG